MLRPRVVVCLDVKDGRVVKGTNFEELRDVGDPVELAARYEAEGADEITFLDISASTEGRGTLLDTVQSTAEVLFVPLTVGGGVRSVDDVGSLLRAGADLFLPLRPQCLEGQVEGAPGAEVIQIGHREAGVMLVEGRDGSGAEALA